MITLSPLDKSDLETVRNWRNSLAVRQHMYTEDVITAEQQVRWFEKVKNDPTAEYKIIKSNGQSIGLVSFTNIDRRNGKCFWAFYIGEETFLGGGVGAKVEFWAIEYVFYELGLNKLICEVLETNNKVISLHKRFGFNQEAFYLEHIFKGGKYYNVVGLALLKRDWEPIRTKFEKLIK